MAAIDPNILNMIETGDLVMYRDASGRSYTLSEIIRAKQAGTFTNLRQGLTRNILTLPDLPQTLSIPNLTSRSVKNSEVTDALAKASVPYLENTRAPHVQSLFSPDDDEMMQKNYPQILKDAELWTALLGDTPDEQVADTLVRLMPVGLLDISGPLRRPLSFNQAPRNVGANKALYTIGIQVLSMLVEQDPNHILRQRMTRFLRDVHTTAATKFFGTGSILGQIGRLKKGFQIKRNAERGRASSDMWATLMDRDMFFAVQDKARPIQAIPTNDPVDIDPLQLLKDPVVTLSDTIDGKEIQLNLVHVTLTADAGFPWESNANKRDSIISDIFLLKAMHDMAKTPYNKAEQEAFKSAFAWTAYHKLKAKAEIYDHADFNLKIRNISVPANAIMILPQMMFKLVKWSTSTLQRPLSSKADNTSLMGYAPFRGGHEKLLEKAQYSARLVLHYADNLFIFQEGRFASMDASSMEAIHTEESIKLCIEYMLTRGFGARFRNGVLIDGGALGDTNAWLIHQWFGTIAASSPGVLRSFIIDVPGLASGMPGTFEFNDMLMALLATTLSQLPPDKNLLSSTGEPLPIVNDMAAQIGFTLKTETFYPGEFLNPQTSLEDARDDPWTPYAESGSICNTDMLGFDTIYVRLNMEKPRAVAILARDRLLKALTFNKSELRQNALGPTTHTIIQLATLNILYLSGGWAHPEIAILIEATAKSLMAELSIGETASNINNTNAASEIISIALSRAAQTIAGEELLDRDMATGILRSMLGTGLIPLTRVFEIIHSKEMADDLLEYTARHPNLSGPKLMRLIGPIEIAKRAAQLERIDAPWVEPTIQAALRALELLKPITESAENLGNPTEGMKKDTPGIPPPMDPRPSTSGTIRKVEELPPEDLRVIINTAQADLGPRPSPVIFVPHVLDLIADHWQDVRQPITVGPDQAFEDDIYGVSAALARAMRVPATMVFDRIDTVSRLLATGALVAKPTDQPGPKRKRRRHSSDSD